MLNVIRAVFRRAIPPIVAGLTCPKSARELGNLAVIDLPFGNLARTSEFGLFLQYDISHACMKKSRKEMETYCERVLAEIDRLCAVQAIFAAPGLAL